MTPPLPAATHLSVSGSRVCSVLVPEQVLNSRYHQMYITLHSSSPTQTPSIPSCHLGHPTYILPNVSDISASTCPKQINIFTKTFSFSTIIYTIISARTLVSLWCHPWLPALSYLLPTSITLTCLLYFRIFIRTSPSLFSFTTALMSAFLISLSG